MLSPRNPKLLSRLKLFAVSARESLAHFDEQPFGISLSQHFDPLRCESEVFHRMLRRLDEVTFGPVGMPMPGWIFLDGASQTGAIVGFALPADRSSAQLKTLLEVPQDYSGLVPLSVFMAVPMHALGSWFAHNLASVSRQLADEDLSGLGSLTKAVALKMFRARGQVGATQWTSSALFVHSLLGPLNLVTALTPAHSDDATLTYSLQLNDAKLRHLARDPAGHVDYPEVDEWIADSDTDRMRALQAEIESGERYVIAGRPKVGANGRLVPVARVPRRRASAAK
jgi:hypothetical protein